MNCNYSRKKTQKIWFLIFTEKKSSQCFKTYNQNIHIPVYVVMYFTALECSYVLHLKHFTVYILSNHTTHDSHSVFYYDILAHIIKQLILHLVIAQVFVQSALAWWWAYHTPSQGECLVALHFTIIPPPPLPISLVAISLVLFTAPEATKVVWPVSEVSRYYGNDSVTKGNFCFSLFSHLPKRC